ncbi:sterol desaturase family protein [Planctobacterium marinum]|uniref:Sterol desaturase n=1 Tax=Planctobacterium marinum TaxID=1631968 RepID=A0AA48KQ66_9ALTE|nr:sterol desaturase [Planctobacterium marinum]
MEIILFAIPFFFLLIAIEIWVDQKKGTQYYQFNDAITSLNLGVMSRLTGIFKLLLPFSAYVWLYQNHAIWQWQSILVLWVVAFVFYDLGYYWVHRISHRMHLMWGSHVVHHSSEEYNLTTALRQTGSVAVFAWLVFLPLAFAGIPPEVFLACAALNLVYQFWVHTRHIDKLPNWFEAIFVTPSHHRVHHALNREYIDKNYAGVFIIWDKIFGSFQAEKAGVEIVYGVSQQLNSYNPIWANLQVYGNILRDVWYTKSPLDKIKTLLMPPGWRAEDMKVQYPGKYVTTKTMRKYQTTLSNAMAVYILAQFTLLVAGVFVFLLQINNQPLWWNMAMSITGIIHCWLISGLQENKPWTRWTEPLRILATSGFIIALQPEINLLSGATIAMISLGLIIWFNQLNAKAQEPNDTPPESLQSDV